MSFPLNVIKVSSQAMWGKRSMWNQEFFASNTVLCQIGLTPDDRVNGISKVSRVDVSKYGCMDIYWTGLSSNQCIG